MLAVLVIEIGTQQVACIVLIEHIKPYHILSISVFSLQVTVNIIVCQWSKQTIRAFGALELSFIA